MLVESIAKSELNIDFSIEIESFILSLEILQVKDL
jgi:hypothetical protein